MRTWSFFLALALMVGGSASAGSTESRLPGAGTFAYLGTPIADLGAAHNSAAR
ncbi:MAG: hypothetical protein ACOY6K_09300 [Pseudomonadota bacterium]|jgi:hypothetical protein